MNTCESKTDKTKRKLQKALMSVCLRKPYCDIAVKDICDEAQIYRSTFYRYYSSKGQLLRDMEDSYIQNTRDLMQAITGFSILESGTYWQIYCQNLAEDLRYHRTHQDVSAFLLSQGENGMLYQKMEHSVAQTYLSSLNERKLSLGPDQPYFARFFASGFVSCIRAWLERDDLTPEEMAKFLASMIYIFSV